MARQVPGLLVLAGMTAMTVGAFLISTPLGLLLGGALAFLVGLAVERAEAKQ